MKQIIAMGGGGFSMEPDNPALDRYILAQASKPRPKVCFLPTARSESADYVMQFYAAFAKLECQPSHLLVFNPPTADLESFIMEKDVIYVGGGNTKSMLAVWREWRLDAILRQAWEKGVVLAGVSAGAICWFEQGLTDSVPGAYTALTGMGYLRGSFSPHFDGEAGRRVVYHRLVASGEMKDGLAADDGAAAHYVDDRLLRVVTSRPHAAAYAIEHDGDSARERKLDVVYLGT